MTRNAALAKRKQGVGERARNLKERGRRLGSVRIERTRGTGARTVRDRGVDLGCLHRGYGDRYPIAEVAVRVSRLSRINPRPRRKG